MSIYPTVTQEDIINLRKIADDQKNQRAHEKKLRFFKRTHEMKLAEILPPITKKNGYFQWDYQHLSEIDKKNWMLKMITLKLQAYKI